MCCVDAHEIRRPNGTRRFESNAWKELHAKYEMKRINHEVAYSDNGACTNLAESYFSHLRRAEQGHHHHIAGEYLIRYAQEAAWREDNRHTSNGEQVFRVAQLALNAKPSVDFAGTGSAVQPQDYVPIFDRVSGTGGRMFKA